jgi:O-acetyl-ADP-ribose deacetylase (regulator of RNase III)
MDERREYTFGTSRLAVLFGDLLESPAEVLVSSDDYLISMGGGVSTAIGAAAGSGLTIDAAKSTPRKLGDVVVTTAGALPARYVFHVITIGPPADLHAPGPDLQDVLGEATRRCLTLMLQLDVTSIAFPALGTGAARIPAATAAAGMVNVIADFLENCSEELSVELRLHARPGVNERDFIAFYEMLAKQAPTLEQHAVPEPATPMTPAGWVTGHVEQAPTLTLEQTRVQLERDLDDAILLGDKPRQAKVLAGLEENVQERTDAAALQRTSNSTAVKVFFSYAHEDEASRDQLSKGLSSLVKHGLISDWHDRKILPGTNWDSAIDDAISSANLALFLISPDFISSEYINGVELKRAYELQREGQLTIIPIYVKPTYLEGDPLLGFQALPTDRKPISTWPNADDAYYDVVCGIAQTVKALAKKPPT